MPYLCENEWVLLNDIVYSVNAVADMNQMKLQFLNRLRLLVPYECAAFYSSDINRENRLVEPVGVDYGTEKQSLYDNHYFRVDYARNMYHMSKSIVFRETDLFEKSVRENTEYYNDYLQPMIHYVSSTIMANHDGLLGNVTLSRTKRQAEFSEREMFILSQLEPHLTNRLFLEKQWRGSQLVSCSSLDYDSLARQYKLTDRETEIVSLIMEGWDNNSIGDRLFISTGTVKKHMGNIFSKIGVSSRTQLMSIFLNHGLQ